MEMKNKMPIDSQKNIDTNFFTVQTFTEPFSEQSNRRVYNHNEVLILCAIVLCISYQFIIRFFFFFFLFDVNSQSECSCFCSMIVYYLFGFSSFYFTFT